MPTRGTATNRQLAVGRLLASGRVAASGRLYVGGSGGADMIVTASLPAAAAADTTSLYRLTVDNKVYFSDGSSWYSFGFNPLMTAPVSADFSWINQGTATIAATNGGLLLTAPVSGSTALRLRVKSAPATPYTITAYISSLFFDGSGNPIAGICFRQSSDGKIATHGLALISNVVSFHISKYNDATTWSGGNYFYSGSDMPCSLTSPGVFLRIADDGSNRIYSYSADGSNFRTLFSVTRTDFLTADQVGFFVNNENGSNLQGLTIGSWIQG